MNFGGPLRHITYAALALATLSLAGCGGGGGSGSPSPSPNPNPNPPPTTGQVAIAGRITFDRPPFSQQIGGGLNLDAPIELPARQVTVEAIDASSSTILASTATNTNGEYSLSVPQNRTVFIRAKAQLEKSSSAPTWNFRVLNNTNGDALYAMDSSQFSSGTSASTRDLHAPLGWNGSRYSDTRVAAPFAILDSVYEAKELILSAEPNRALPALDLFWSASNRTNQACVDDGDIGTTFYTTGGADDCVNNIPAGIYILGDHADGNGDTDEFDAHVIAHEFGHYYEDRFSRSDSIGGDHDPNQRLDFRLAFGEGWGNAFAGMTLDNPEYRDSYVGGDTDFGYNMESDDPSPEGWFNEGSVSEILWDIYDGGAEPNDPLALGFAPIHRAMIDDQRTTQSLTSIFSFAEAFRDANPTDASGLNALLAAEGIANTDEFGSSESNDGGDDSVLPLYQPILLNQQTAACSRAVAGAANANKLGNRKYFTFDNDRARTVAISVIGAPNGTGTDPATDPDVFVYQAGDVAAASQVEGNESFTVPLAAGLHIVEVYDFEIQNFPSTTRCMTVSLTGN